MAQETTVLNALKTQLTNNTTLAAYVKNIFLGVRKAVPSFPFIVIEPQELLEADDVYGRQDLRFRVQVVGFIECLDPEKQIVGDATNKGIMDLMLDVKKAISADRTVGGTAIHAYIQSERFEYVEYPVRSVVLTVELFFRQASVART